jgi:hypothetical protein
MECPRCRIEMACEGVTGSLEVVFWCTRCGYEEIMGLGEAKVREFLEALENIERTQKGRGRPLFKKDCKIQGIEPPFNIAKISECPVVVYEGQRCAGWQQYEDFQKYNCSNCKFYKDGGEANLEWAKELQRKKKLLEERLEKETEKRLKRKRGG